MGENAPDVPRFSKEDSDKLVEFLNFVATSAEFNKLTVKRVLDFARLLNWAQTSLLPKIDAHIFEVVSVKEGKRGKK